MRLLISLCLLAMPTPAAGYSCSMTATNIVFGSIDVTSGAAMDSTATLTLTCVSSASNQTLRMCVSIDGGSAWDATSRLMNGPSAPQLRYQLYSDAARTTVWGSWPAGLYGGGSTWDVYTTSNSIKATTTVYGRVLGSQQTIPAGSYSSTLTLYFTYLNGSNNPGPCPDAGHGNATTTFSATATVLPSCLVGAGNLSFGTVGTLASNIDATSSIKVQCSNGLPYQVGLNAGIGTGVTVSNRKMTLGATGVGYALYRNSGRTMNWGNTAGTDTVGGTGNGAAQLHTVYGRVPTQSTPAAGTYNDTIVVTVTY